MLAAWAQMRHTWALQAKEVWITLGFEDYPKPVGFVEPVPKFFQTMAVLVDRFRQFMGDGGVLEPDRANLARHMRMRAEELFVRAQAIGADEPFGDINRRSLERTAQESLQQAESIESGHDDALDWASHVARDPRLKRKWERLHFVCGRLQELAAKQLRGERHDEADRFRAMNLNAQLGRATTGDEVKLLVSDQRSQIKIEVNYVFRGTVMRPERRALTPAARNLFTAEVDVPILPLAELYGSKLVAAMDRQHPRDFFDVMAMYQHFGLTQVPPPTATAPR